MIRVLDSAGSTLVEWGRQQQQQQQLLKDNSNELTTEELEHLQNEQERKLADEIEEKEEIDENVSSALIKEMISK